MNIKNFNLDDIFNQFSPVNPKMKCDIFEEDGKYHIEMDMPGFNKEDIKIETDKGNLIVRVEKANETKNEQKNYIHRERTYEKMQRSFYVGDVNVNEIKASFNNGTLNIIVPKNEIDEHKNFVQID